MMQVMAALSSPSQTADRNSALASGEQRFVIHGVTYPQYVALRESFDVPGLRMAYYEGTLELMSPSIEHERIKSLLARMIELWAVESDVPVYAYGSTTFRKEAADRGLEPDECYFVGGDFDAERRAFPDIALEVALSSGGLNKLAIYSGLGVKEVWFWRGGGLELHALREGGLYERIAQSELLPSLDVELVARFAERRDQPQALKEYWLALGEVGHRAR